MEWKGQEESRNVEDRRGMSTGTKIVGGGIGTLLIAIVVYFLGGDPAQVMNSAPPAISTGQSAPRPGDDSLKQLSSVVLRSTEKVWTTLFSRMNNSYTDPTLVMFSDQTESGCGGASSATGPFYCPADQKVYLDLSFFHEMNERFQVRGNFAMAYVIAHEVGHHVQNLLGISGKVRRLQEQTDERGANKLSVRLELQADFLAGVWAHYAEELKLDNSDIASALNAANAIGDDRLQKEAQGYVVPDAFTHGTSQQRMYWFRKGYETGDINQGDTFSADDI